MIARSRLVGNFLSHCAVHRQLTRVIGLNQSVRLHSTNDNPDKNSTLKLPPNATGVSVEHSNLDRAMSAGPHCINGKLIDTHETREELVSTHVKDEVFAMFVIGLSENTTDEDIYQTFSKVGTLMQCEVIRDRDTNRSLRYAIVSFSTFEELAKALEKKRYWIDSQRVTVKPKKDTPILDDESRKILVKNLPKSATDEQLQKIFSEFGQLTDWGVKWHGSYGWVSFAHPIKVGTLEEKSPTIFGKMLDFVAVENWSESFEDSISDYEYGRDDPDEDIADIYYLDHYIYINDDESEPSFCDNTILVKYLPITATGEQLKKIFSEFGQLTDWGVKWSRGYGWVSFARPIKVGTLEDKSPTMFGKIFDLEAVESATKEFADLQKKWKKLYGHKW
ncbi:RNA recognition motif domain-containing protein [Ditylenchus destructor]|nr:RNA recognition motif domain-containing protein [Ditylenchus destructor]